MTDAIRLKYLRIALVVIGMTYMFGIYILTVLWPSGWAWHAEGRSEYLEMILGIYATLGAFLILAARDPGTYTNLIWFTVWSNVVHAAIMGVNAVVNPRHIGHLWGDVLALVIVTSVLVVLTPRVGGLTKPYYVA